MYTHFYGFAEEPFRDAPDPRFFFDVPGNERTLNCLRRAAEEKSGWVLLSGEPGSGKTISIRRLLLKLAEKPDVKTVYIFQTRVSFEDLLKAILTGLSLSPTPAADSSLAEHFCRTVSQLLTPPGSLLLFLDEAQDFGVEVLEKIERFFGREFPRPERLQVFLSGQTSLEEKLNSQELRLLKQRIRYRCPVKKLTETEARRYLDHRLHLAGGKADIFSPQALSLIIRYGEGVPRTLNILCDNALRIGHQISEPKVSAAVVRKALKEMYAPAGREVIGEGPAAKKPFPRKLLYALAAAFGVFMLILFTAERPPKEKTPPNAAAVAPSPALKIEEPAPPPAQPEGNPPQKMLANPPFPKAQTDSLPAESQSPAAVSAPEEIKPQPKVKKVISVKKGATLNSLCGEHFGYTNVTLLDHIMALNPELTNPDLILVNQQIRLPDIGEESLVREAGKGIFRVFLGTFSRPDAVQSFRQEPLLKGREVEITSWKIGTGETWHRLSVGGFAGRDEALKTIRALKERGVLPSFGGSPAQFGKNA